MKGRRAVFALLACGALVRLAACSDAASELPHADEDAGSGVADAIQDTAPPVEAGFQYTTEGWARLDFDPAVDCGFYAAPPEKMPPPMVWEPCETIATATGVACRQIKVDWPEPTGPLKGQQAQAPATSGSVDSAGRALLAVTRLTGDSVYQLVGEADGPIRFALRYGRPNCYLTEGNVRAGKAVYAASRMTGSTIYRIGAIGGAIDSVPLLLESWGDGVSRSYFAGANAYFAYGAMAVRPWLPAPPGSPIGTLEFTDPGQVAQVQFQGDALFFSVMSLSYARIKVFVPGTGVKDFVSFGNDVSANAAGLGTDGNDMAWVEAFGRAQVGDPWPTINIMTAKYTTDPSKLEKRRLRSEAGGVADVFQVGCGYGARPYNSKRDGVGVHLVRLADGRSWRIKEIMGKPAWTWTNVLAVTCDEVFVNVAHGGAFRVARVRIDSLGPGDAPD